MDGIILSSQVRRVSTISPLDATQSLTSLGHHNPQNVVNARGIASPVLLKPFEHVGIQAHGHQFLWRRPELGELLIAELRNVGIVDLRNARAFLPPCNSV